MKSIKSVPQLEKGQLWKFGENHLEIVQVGKRLVHYRLFKTHRRVATKMISLEEIQQFLKAKNAELGTA